MTASLTNYIKSSSVVRSNEVDDVREMTRKKNTSTCIVKRTRHLSRLLVKTIAKLRDTALDLIKSTALLSSISLDDVHDSMVCYQPKRKPFSAIEIVSSKHHLTSELVRLAFVGTE